MGKIDYSVVTTAYNEEGNLKILVDQLQRTMNRLGKPWELICVNDGSTDKTEAILRQLAHRQANLKVVNLAKNYGKTAALTAGFEQTQGKIVITIDADLQNNPQDILRLLKIIKEKKADAVIGWRKNRADPALRTLVSRLANKMINLFMDSRFQDSGCPLQIYKKEFVSSLGLYGEMHRFLPHLVAAQGAKVIETPVAHYPRRFGKSKYGFIRTFKVLLDLITLKFLTGFQTKPIYMFGFAGLVFFFLSFLGTLYVIGKKILYGSIGYSPVLFSVVILFNAGVTCTLMGLLAEIQIRTWYESTNRKEYLIKEIVSRPIPKSKT